jgi:ABC-type multidrug transport system fused ATPase/permease subunit
MVFNDVVYETDGNRILDGVRLAIPCGSVVDLNASTLLSLVAVFIHGTGGVIQVDGADIRRFRAANWRRLMGIVPHPHHESAGVRRELLSSRGMTIVMACGSR